MGVGRNGTLDTFVCNIVRNAWLEVFNLKAKLGLATWTSGLIVTIAGATGCRAVSYFSSSHGVQLAGTVSFLGGAHSGQVGTLSLEIDNRAHQASGALTLADGTKIDVSGPINEPGHTWVVTGEMPDGAAVSFEGGSLNTAVTASRAFTWKNGESGVFALAPTRG